MSTLSVNLVALAQAIGVDIGSINARIGTLSTLTTTEKTNLVGALNEVRAKLLSVETSANGAARINDTTKGAATTYSSNKIEAYVSAKIADLIGGAPAAFDTLKEIADYIASDQTATSALTTAINNRVRFDAAQTLTAAQQAQACANIGVGDPATDFVASYTTAKA
ncbi:hypothetical protein [Alcaligenes sp. HNGD-HTN06]|uniref:hypothetical protein n=1 Tax=Alcaligenes sp. HNGD-HTN06 TaxID=3416924 RepID=UPI003CEC9AB3